MHVVIAYDISDNKNRQTIFHTLKELGINSQLSVFECELSTDEIYCLLEKVNALISKETDSVLVYPLCKRCAAGVQIIGQGIPIIHTDYEVI